MGETVNLFANRVFYHGTSLEAAEQIVQQGFRERFLDSRGDMDWSGGNLGTGVYISANWRTSLWFGDVLFRVDLRPGTRVLDASEAPDAKVIQYLRREFGRAILTEPPLRAMPKNKQLTLPELVSLFRYHYFHTWEREYAQDEFRKKWTAQRELHSRLLNRFRSLLIRYGFHGYGNPTDDNGIVLFSGDRIVLTELIGEVPSAVRAEGMDWDNPFPRWKSVEDVRQVFWKNGSEPAKRLAERIASAAARS